MSDDEKVSVQIIQKQSNIFLNVGGAVENNG